MSARDLSEFASTRADSVPVEDQIEQQSAVDLDEAADLGEAVGRGGAAPSAAAVARAAARLDADEADVLEQSLEVPLDDDYPHE